MATPLNIVGQHVIDLFYQDYKGTSQFFDVDDGTYFAGVAYADLLGQEYKLVYDMMRKDGDEDIVSFSHDWLDTQVLEVKNGEATLQYMPMSFPYDKQDCGIQNIFPVASNYSDEIIRSNISSIWMDKFLPNTNAIYWALLKNKIIFKHTVKSPPSSVRVVYVPEVSDSLQVPSSRENMIVQMAVQLMLKAKEGNLVKETNDQNKNTAPQTEMDRNLIQP